MRSEFGKNFVVIALLVAVGLSCKSTQPLGSPHILKSRDGKFQITVPAVMAESTTLSTDAEIQAANTPKSLFVFLVTKKKSDFQDGTTLEKVTNTVRDALIGGFTVNDSPGPESITVDGNPALRYRLGGTKDGVKLVYVITNVETPDHFHFIYSWTDPSHLSENEPILKEIGDSFRVNP